jgi:guanylate kinase
VNPFPIILSAPSGGGKTTIARALLSRRGDLGYSISCTTRPAREGEVHGRDYYFMARSDFLRQQEAGAFAESAEVHGNLYGTLRSEVHRVLSEGRHVLMDIDVQGAAQFKRAFSTAVMVFVLPPSAKVLVDRLRSRKTEGVEELRLRLQSALQELEAANQYKHLIVNDDLERAVARVSAIIDGEVESRKQVTQLRLELALLIDDVEGEIRTRSTQG